MDATAYVSKWALVDIAGFTSDQHAFTARNRVCFAPRRRESTISAPRRQHRNSLGPSVAQRSQDRNIPLSSPWTCFRVQASASFRPSAGTPTLQAGPRIKSGVTLVLMADTM